MSINKLKYFCFFLFFVVQFNFGQKIIEITDDFDSKLIKEELGYYLDSLGLETVESIQTKRFSPYTINFPGLLNTRFWFRLGLNNTTSTTKNLVYKINTVSFKNLCIYEVNEEDVVEIFRFEEKMNKNIEIPISILMNQTQDYYFQVDFVKSIYFPFQILTEVELINENKKNHSLLGLYYGFSIMILLINLFFYINTKNKFFLYYCFLLLSITLILAELDGLFFVVLGNTNYIRHVDITLHLLLVVSVMLFTTKAIRLDYYCPKLKKMGILVILANALCFLIYVVSGNLLWYSIGEGLNALALSIYWIVGFILLKKEIYARYIVVGYTIIFISNILYVLPSEFGLIDVGFTDRHLKIGGFFEMVVFLYAISYRHKNVENEKRELIKNLDKKIEEDEFLNKSQDEILTFFIKKYKLTSRESEIVVFILKGATNKEIGDQLSIQLSTVKYHVSNLYVKLDIKKRTELSFLYANFMKNRG